jgi:hypothetical protein
LTGTQTDFVLLPIVHSLIPRVGVSLVALH